MPDLLDILKEFAPTGLWASIIVAAAILLTAIVKGPGYLAQAKWTNAKVARTVSATLVQRFKDMEAMYQSQVNHLKRMNASIARSLRECRKTVKRLRRQSRTGGDS